MTCTNVYRMIFIKSAMKKITVRELQWKSLKWSRFLLWFWHMTRTVLHEITDSCWCEKSSIKWVNLHITATLGITDIWEHYTSITLQDQVSPEAAFRFPAFSPPSECHVNAFSPASHWRWTDLHYSVGCQ